jgi:large subunit ribosomal protein L24|tara:strand:+ start:262 stop:588 length:327 start_codon:yes stop_codon:yes gene_type:complete
MAKLKLKKDDLVKVISGKERGKKGKILAVFPKENRLIVEKLNMIKKHAKADQKTGKGGIVEKEAKIYCSNIMVICVKCDRAVRVGKKKLDDGKNVRICKKCGEILDKG